MTKSVFSNSVEQFSDWNSKLRQLLREAEKDDVHSEMPHDDEVEGDDADNSILDDIRSVAGDMGADLWSVTIFNTEDNFYNIRPDILVSSKLKNIDDSVVDGYLGRDEVDIGNNKAISCLIYNDRTGEFVEYYSGDDGEGFEPGELTVDSDQATILDEVERAGREYNRLQQEVEWRPGTEAQGPLAERLYDSLSRLKGALALNEPVDKIRDVYISPEQKEKNDEYGKEADAAWLAYKAAKEKNKGVGREKR